VTAGDWRPVARLDALPDGKPIALEVDGQQLAVCRDGDRVFVVEDKCPHRGAPFSEMGHVREGRLTCEWHYWQFDLATGEHCQVPTICVRRWRARVVGGLVEVDISGPIPLD
jgi:nitrite reductase (NADH) small subunit